MSSRLTHVVVYVRIFFLFKAEKYSLVIYIPHFAYPSVHQQTLGLLCEYILAFVNNAVISMGIQIPLQDPAFNFGGYIPISGIAGSYGNCIFNIFRNCHAVFHSLYTILHYHYQ